MSDMALRELRCYLVELPVSAGKYTMSDGRNHSRISTTIVEVVHEDGLRGFGEACTLGNNYIDGFAAGVRAAVHELAPIVLATDPFRPDVLLQRMDSALRGHSPAKAAIDAAMLDLRGRLLGLPVCDLLGGRHQATYALFHPVTLTSPAGMAEEAGRLAEIGYRCWQLKLGDDPVEDAARAALVRESLGERCHFMSADANRGWTAADALRFLAAVGDLDIYLEQPCETLAELELVHQSSSLPMIADESICDAADLVRCFGLGVAEAINIKPARVGGLNKAARLRDLAQALGLRVVIDDAMGGLLATAGIGHLAATCRPRTYVAAFHPTAELIDVDEAQMTGGPRVEGGRAAVPEAPGLGVQVDAERLGEPVFTVEPGTTEQVGALS